MNFNSRQNHIISFSFAKCFSPNVKLNTYLWIILLCYIGTFGALRCFGGFSACYLQKTFAMPTVWKEFVFFFFSLLIYPSVQEYTTIANVSNPKCAFFSLSYLLHEQLLLFLILDNVRRALHLYINSFGIGHWTLWVIQYFTFIFFCFFFLRVLLSHFKILWPIFEITDSKQPGSK